MERIIFAAVALHHFRCKLSPDSYTPKGYIDEDDEDGNIIYGSWHDDSVAELLAVNVNKDNNPPKSAEQIRGLYADYFFGLGQVPWQWKLLV